MIFVAFITRVNPPRASFIPNLSIPASLFSIISSLVDANEECAINLLVFFVITTRWHPCHWFTKHIIFSERQCKSAAI
jgi:hypothetical protein